MALSLLVAGCSFLGAVCGSPPRPNLGSSTVPAPTLLDVFPHDPTSYVEGLIFGARTLRIHLRLVCVSPSCARSSLLSLSLSLSLSSSSHLPTACPDLLFPSHPSDAQQAMLFESAGQYAASELREIVPSTGQPVAKTTLPSDVQYTQYYPSSPTTLLLPRPCCCHARGALGGTR